MALYIIINILFYNDYVNLKIRSLQKVFKKFNTRAIRSIPRHEKEFSMLLQFSKNIDVSVSAVQSVWPMNSEQLSNEQNIRDKVRQVVLLSLLKFSLVACW